MKNTKRKLPEGWLWKKLGGKKGVANIINGSTPSTDNPEYWDGDILWATPSDLGKLSSIHIDDTERKITKAGLDSCSTTLLPVDTVLLTSRAPVGNLAITKKPICTNQGFKSFIPKEEINSLYLYFAIKKIVPAIQKQSHGNTFTEITKELVQNFEIPFPPTRDDQIRIASELERNMAETEKMRQAALSQKEAIAAMQGAILREVFPYKAGDKLPEGWNWKRFKNMGRLSQGGTPSTDVLKYWEGNIPFITGADITNLHVSKARSFLTEKGLHSGKTQKCEKGDLLIVSRTRVGRIGIAKTTLGISQDVSVLRVNEGFDVKYLAMFLQSISRQLEEACQGATIKGLTRDYIENILIPLPPTLDDQKRIASELERKLAEIEKMRQAADNQLEAIEALPGAILRVAFDFEEEEAS
jgi:type I restriction enzyme S subunit